MKTKFTPALYALIVIGTLGMQNVHAQTYASGPQSNTCGAGTAGTTNTLIGCNAGGAAVANGTENTFVGDHAGAVNTYAKDNVGVGNDALHSQSYANGNTAWSTFNTAVGSQALFTNQPTSNVNGYYNTALGYKAGYTNATGQKCVFVGAQAGLNSTASFNTFVGFAAGSTNSSGSLNTFVGYIAGTANTTGSNNTYIGLDAGYANTTGSHGTGCGLQALGQSTTGNNNTAVGEVAGYTNTTGSNNTYFGYSADASAGSTNLSNSSAIGYNATVCASNQMVFGDNNVVQWGFGVCPAAGHAVEVGSGATNGNGAYLTTGGIWTNTSSRSFKDNITAVDGRDILSKINQLEVSRWKYKGTEEYHIGPLAEQFYELFNTGLDNQHISTVDPSGVALVGIKELSKQFEAAKSENEQLKNDLAALKSQVAQLDNALAQCCMSYQQSSTKISGSTSTDRAQLGQNSPNPFNDNTVIKYYVPSQSGTALIKIFSLDGAELKTFVLSQKGNGELSIAGSTFAAGTYTYTLIIDGNKVDSKFMVLSK